MLTTPMVVMMTASSCERQNVLSIFGPFQLQFLKVHKGTRLAQLLDLWGDHPMKPLIYCYLQHFSALGEHAFVHNTGCHGESRQFCHAKFEGVFWEPLLLIGFQS